MSNYVGPAFGFQFDFSKRDIACFIFALSVHSLLLLWKGGMLSLQNQPGGDLGDMLVNVDFRSDIPSFDAPAGGSAPKAQGLLARMKSMIQGKGAAEKKSDLAMGTQTQTIQPPNQTWTKTDVLTNKPFADKKGFEGLHQKKDALEVAKGQIQEVQVKPSDGNFKNAEPNLKENTFKIAKKDVPFKIVSSKSNQELVNVNAIAVNVGAQTTPNVKSLDGGPGAGPALQSKTLASKGAATSGGFSGLPSGSKSGTSSGASLAMGSGSGPAGLSNAGSGISGSGGSGGSGFGNGTGNGVGSGSGSGTGGRTYGGGSGFGVGSGTGVRSLPRNTVPVESISTTKNAPYNSGFNISGALANRPIVSKTLAAYEIDCRVGLRFRVDWSGKVLDGIIVEISSGSPSFDQKVVAALQKWVFSKLPADKTNLVQEGMITFVFKGV
ncbi:MAG: hypothetical protein KCHDKBKB_02587 [Elusimicrobia bacterium]|nr:hypothetical protein [Elusimicrobiota bacterium]